MCPSPPSPPYRVLLVEDNRLIRDVFSHGFANFFQKARAFVVDPGFRTICSGSVRASGHRGVAETIRLIVEHRFRHQGSLS
jgi:hypothetical protein